MPYVICPDCGASTYSAALRAMFPDCPRCGRTLSGARAQTPLRETMGGGVCAVAPQGGATRRLMAEPRGTRADTRPGGLRLRRRIQGATTVLEVEGEIDIASSPEFERQAATAAAVAQETLVVDLERVTFMDSTGLHVLLRTTRRAAERRVRLVVARPRGAVAQLFHIVGVGDVLTVV